MGLWEKGWVENRYCSGMENDTTHWHIGTRLGRGFSLIGDRGKDIGTGDSLPLMSQSGWPLVSDDGSQKGYCHEKEKGSKRGKKRGKKGSSFDL